MLTSQGAGGSLADSSAWPLPNLSIVALLDSLHPPVTVPCPRGLLGERMRSVQLVGIVLAIGGACLIGGGYFALW